MTTKMMTSTTQHLIDLMEREHATTLKVLRAYPADQAHIRPHSKCKTALELAWVFVIEQGLAQTLLTTGIDFTKPMPAWPEPPATLAAVIGALEQAHAKTMTLVRALTQDGLHETVKFFVAPKTLGDVPKLDFLEFMTHDQIHHRGQLSIYLRMADGKVPSIYGPSADEPFF